MVIEDAPNPSLSRNEFASSTGIVPALLGKHVGDEFSLSEGRLIERAGIVIEIQDKRIYRSNQLMIAWIDRFPNEPFFLEPVRIRISETPSQEDFAEMIQIMERMNRQRERLFEAYNEGKLSISSLAQLNGSSVFETVNHLAVDPGLRIFGCGGRTQELEAAVQILREVSSLLLDPTAVAMFILLEETDILEILPFECLVTEGTLQDLRNLLRGQSTSGSGQGYVGSKDGRLWSHELDPEEKAKWVDRLKTAIDELEIRCKVIGGRDLATIDVDLREQLRKYYTQGSAETAAAAFQRADENAAIWSDDHILISQLRSHLPAPRVWTQSVFVWATRTGILESFVTSRVAARMLRFGYFFTSLDSRMVLDACETASWRPTDPDLSAVLADFGNRGWERGVALAHSAQTLAGVWQQAPTEEHARLITARMLVHLRERDDHEEIVPFLLSNLDSLLGLALTRENALRSTLVSFLRGGVVPI